MANSIVDFIHGYKVRCIDELDPPVLLAVVEGTAGTTSYTYKASYVTLVGESLPSETVVVTTGNATLSGFNKIKLSITNIPDSVTYIRFWKYVGGVWVKIADVAQDPGQLYDTGQTTTAATLPVTNTSGRKGVIAICPSPGTLNQRMNWMDLQSIIYRKYQRLWDGIHKNGDIISGCVEIQNRGVVRENSTAYLVGDMMYVNRESQFTYICTTAGTSASSDPGSWPVVADTTKTDGDVVWTCKCKWTMTSGEMYIFGIVVDVSEGEIELTGAGTEVIGVTISPIFTTSTEDSVQRAGFDEGAPPLYSNAGPDWLYLQIAWVKDEEGQTDIKEFLNGVPKKDTLPIERSVLDKKIAQGIYDVSGNFTVENFPLKIEEYTDDLTKLTLVVDPGYIYANGFPVKTSSTKRFQFNKARDTWIENESTSDVFEMTGGDCIGTIEGPFNVEGKSIKFKVGSGNYHTIALVGSSKTAAEVGAQIVAALVSDGYPDILTYVATTILQLQAEDGKSLEIATLASDDAAPILGLAAGTYSPEGTRLYQLGDYYIKFVTDMSYKVKQVLTMTRGSSSYDYIEDLSSIIGIADTLIECHDGKYNYESGDDYQKSTIEGVGTCIDWSLGGDEEPTAGHTYYAKVRVNYEPTKAVRQKVLVTDVPIVKGAEDGTDNLLFTSASSIVRAAINPSTGEPYLTSVSLSGNASDVISIVRVNNSTGQSATQYSAHFLLKNSGALAHDTSQISWINAGPQNTGVTGQPITGNTYYVTFYAWAHITEGDVVTADCYDSYSDIESYAGVWLRDQLDFRTTGTLPAPGEDVNLDYEYYLARVDKLVCDDLGNITILTGSPGKTSPVVPSDKDGLTSLAIILIAPYTYSISNATIRSTESMRITQRGIHDLQKQVDWLRYFLIKNSLEQQRVNEAAQITGDAKGLFVDAITGMGNADVTYERIGLIDIAGVNSEVNILQTAAIDMQARHIRLPATKTEVVIESDIDEPVPVTTGVRRLGNSLLLDYNPEEIISQMKAGITMNCAPDNIYDNYVGHMALSPETDVFIDQTQLPALNIVDEDNNLAEAVATMYGERFSNIDWGNWHTTSGSGYNIAELRENLAEGNPDRINVFYPWNIGGAWAGSQVSDYWLTPTYSGVYQVRHVQTGEAERTGTRTQILPGTITRDLGNLVVDMSLLYNMRTTNADGSPFVIQVAVTGLIPNTDHCLTIAGIAVDFTYDSTATVPFGAIGTHTYQGKTTVSADNNGKLTGKFTMPSGISIGVADVKCFLYTGATNSYASAVFYSQGFNVSQRETTIGIPSIETSCETFTETEPLVQIERRYYDPVAQSFFIPTAGSKYRYISEVDLYFKSVSTTKPISVQIRNMVNGMPGKVEYATATIDPEVSPNVLVTSSNGSLATTFVFDKVIGYTAGTDYCLVVMPGNGNTDYETFISELGTMDFVTQTVINVQSNPGVMFHSPNGYTWDPWTKRDLKFKLYESNFRNDMQVMWKTLTGIQASQFCLIVNEVFGPGAEAKWFYSLDAGLNWISTTPRIDTELSQVITQVWLKVDVTSSGGVYSVTDKYGGILIIYNNGSAFHVIPNTTFTDNLNYPNKVSFIFDVAADMSVRKVTPYYSTDDGLNWVKVEVPAGFIPTVTSEPFYNYTFTTPPEVTITGATNASPIVITSAGHGYQNNAIVIIAGVGGNTAANNSGEPVMLKNVTTDTAELYQVDGTTAIAGNSAYTDTGTMTLNEFDQCRGMLLLETSNRALTPKIANLAMSCYREAS